MKTRFFSVFLFCSIVSFFGARNGYSQRASANNNNISLDFIDQFIRNVISVQYEVKLTSTSSLAVRGQYVTSVSSTTGFGAGGEWRFYVADTRALEGLNIGPGVDLFFFKNNDLQKTNILFAVGGDVAYKWFFGNFTVEPFIGARIGFTGSDVIPGVNNFSGLHLFGGMYLGWAW